MPTDGPAIQTRHLYGSPAGWAALNDIVGQGWQVAATLTEDGRPPRYDSWERVPCGPNAMRYLKQAFPAGLYVHQAESLRRLATGANVCMTTATASGKSAVFYGRGVDVLDGDPHATVLALYPTRALVAEQQQRWEQALRLAGIGVRRWPLSGHQRRPSGELVARLDGSVSGQRRLGSLACCAVAVATPDVVHAWLLSHVTEREVREFLRHLRLVVVDEVHQYTGVFGSNAAFLFRRLRHMLHTVGGGEPQFIAASATVAAPQRHLDDLFGVSFELVGPEFDGSALQPKAIRLVTPPSGMDLLTSVSELIHVLRRQEHARFVTFVDSRKQAELICAIVRRGASGSPAALEEGEADDDRVEQASPRERRWPGDGYEVLPYRAGLEEEDREAIQTALSQGALKGVVSTSALELGVDIPHLDIGVLVGVPASATSLRQRIGRVGRARAGSIFVVNSGSVLDQTVFQDPESLLRRPLAEPALYLSTRRIQSIHALCLARDGGEHDRAASAVGNKPDSSSFSSPVQWPDGFLDLCMRERTGVLDSELRSLKEMAGDEPHHVFPLRDVEQQFNVECRRGDVARLGTLTHSQLMREAYPGAVYYYMAVPYRVVQVQTRSRVVLVKRERQYNTSPIMWPTQLFPDLSEDEVLSAWRFGDLRAIETVAQVRDAVTGFKERRGGTEMTFTYPIRASSDDHGTGLADTVYYPQDRFMRVYFTTAVLLLHPQLEDSHVEISKLANVLLEAFFFVVPFERQDLSVAVDRIRRGTVPESTWQAVTQPQAWSGIPAIPTGARFIAIYDQTYGSLRLSGRLLEPGILARVMETALQLATHVQSVTLNVRTLEVLENLASAARQQPQRWEPPGKHPWAVAVRGPEVRGEAGAGDAGGLIRVIRPGSRGIALRRDNEEFLVEKVLPFHPRHQGPVYKGRFASEERLDTTATFVAVADVAPIPGESDLVWYDPERDEFASDPEK